MTLLEALRRMPVDEAAEFIFNVSDNPCVFCVQDYECKNRKIVRHLERFPLGSRKFEKVKRICVDQITVGLLQEV